MTPPALYIPCCIQVGAKKVGSEDIERMLEELEAMSDEQTRQLLPSTHEYPAIGCEAAALDLGRATEEAIRNIGNMGRYSARKDWGETARIAVCGLGSICLKTATTVVQQTESACINLIELGAWGILKNDPSLKKDAISALRNVDSAVVRKAMDLALLKVCKDSKLAEAMNAFVSSYF